MTRISEKILEILKERGKMLKDELVKEVAKETGKEERIVKAILTKMIKRGKVRSSNGYVYLP